MPRIRTIKPELFVSETLAQVSLAAERTFTGLLTQADDRGRFRYNAAVLNGALWPLRPEHTPEDFQSEVMELMSVGALCCYEVDGKQYGHFPTWEDHQRISHPSTRLLSPECPLHDAHSAVSEAPEGVGREFNDDPHEGITGNFDVNFGNFPEGSGKSPEGSGKTPQGKGKGSLEKDLEKDQEGEKPTQASARPRAAKNPEPQTPTPAGRKTPKSKAKNAPTAVDTATVTDAFLDSVRGMGNKTKVQAVVKKALEAGYDNDATLSALQRAHQDGKPLTAEVLHQYLEGFDQHRKVKTSSKSIHYAADAPRDASRYREDL